MTRCDQTQQVHRYHDGELDTGATAAVEAHLAGCPACAAELASLRALGADLRSLAAATPIPIDFGRTIHRRVERVADAGALRLAAWLTAVAAAVVFACVLRLEWFPAENQPGLQSGSPGAGSVNAGSPAPMAETINALAMHELGPAANEEQQIALWMVADLSRHSSIEVVQPRRPRP